MSNLLLSCQSEAADDSIRVGAAVNQLEKEEIYRLRYQIYVEEMSKRIESADYQNRFLCDELDPWAVLLYAKIGSRIIATARVNIGTIKQYPVKLVQILALDQFAGAHNVSDPAFAYITKLMVVPAYRSSPALYLLIAKCYEICCDHQVDFAFGACNLQLLRLYEQMGFHRYTSNFVDPGYGLLAPIVLLINDIKHLRRVRSPLFRIARKRTEFGTEAVEWFYSHFFKTRHNVNSQIVNEDELWSILAKHLAPPFTQAIDLLQGLSEGEAKKFLHNCGIYVHCDAGDMIVNQGDISYSYNLLLSGTLKSLTFRSPAKYYLPGQHFGANGLTGHNVHNEDIVAASATEILVLSGIAFPRFSHAYPDIAHKVVKTIVESNNRSIKD